MPNRFSHAIVLSDLASRGLINFPSPSDQPPFADDSTLHIEPRARSGKIREASVPTSPPKRPLPPTPEEVSDTETIRSKPSSRQATPSVITEIYAPESALVPPSTPTISNRPPETASHGAVSVDEEVVKLPPGSDSLSSSLHEVTPTPTTMVSPVKRSTPFTGSEQVNSEVSAGIDVMLECVH